MIPSVRPFQFIAIVVAALALATCAGTGGSGFDVFNSSGASNASLAPKTFVVSDFIFSSDVTAVDRGYTARLQRKIGSFPTHERKQRTIERVNEEIVAAITATLDEAGLKAAPGSEEALTLKDDLVLVGGRMRPANPAEAAKNKQTGFGVADGAVIADMTLSHFSAGGKNLLLQFNAPMPHGRSVRLDRKRAAARDVAIEAALVAEGAPAARLSAATEAQARALGRAVGERIVAFARERGWLAKAEVAATMPASSPKTSPAGPRRPGR